MHLLSTAAAAAAAAGLRGRGARTRTTNHQRHLLITRWQWGCGHHDSQTFTVYNARLTATRSS
jgi:hypothetical protein